MLVRPVRSALRSLGLAAASALATIATAWACTGAASIATDTRSGPPGTSVRVYGDSFTERDVEIRWHSAEGPLLGMTEGPRFTTTVLVPDAPAGPHLVLAVERDSDGSVARQARTAFEVTSRSTAGDEAQQPAPPGETTAPDGARADGGKTTGAEAETSPPAAAQTTTTGSARPAPTSAPEPEHFAGSPGPMPSVEGAPPAARPEPVRVETSSPTLEPAPTADVAPVTRAVGDDPGSGFAAGWDDIHYPTSLNDAIPPSRSPSVPGSTALFVAVVAGLAALGSALCAGSRRRST